MLAALLFDYFIVFQLEEEECSTTPDADDIKDLEYEKEHNQYHIFFHRQTPLHPSNPPELFSSSLTTSVYPSIYPCLFLFLMASSPENDGELCYSLCPSSPYKYDCTIICIPLTPQVPFPPPFSPPPESNQHIPRIVIIIVVLASVFLLVSICSLIIKHSSRRNSLRSSTAPGNNANQDHDHINNPRHVRAVGLEESVINSITVCKYRRGGGRVEGTECSICLNEFRDDENLRLLPSCSHAFHLPCIDTWLKSHQNCPLCRSKVVSDQIRPPSADPSSCPDSEGGPQIGNSQRNIGLGRNETNGVVVDNSSVHGGTASELRELPSSRGNNSFRSNSDLIENNRFRECRIQMMDDDGMQRVRRSVSMDSSAAWMISISVANLAPIDSEGSSKSKGDGISNLVESMGSKSSVPMQIGKQTVYQTMGNHSEGPSVQENPTLVLKRSFSGGGKFLLTRY